MPVSTNVEDQLLRWALDQSFEDLVLHNNYIRSLLKDEYARCTDLRKKEQVEVADQRNSINSFLNAFSALEELLAICKRVRASTLPPSQGSGLERFKPMLAHMGIDLGSIGAWAFLVDSSLIRDCLMHAHGRINLMRNPSAVVACINRYPDKLALVGQHVRLTPDFVHTFVKKAREFADCIVLPTPPP